MNTRRRLGLILLILFSCVGCDQVTKGIAKAELEHAPPILLFGNAIQLIDAENQGGMLSFGQTFSQTARFWVFTVGVSLGLILGFVYALINISLHATEIISLSLILGGGLSNLVDRILYDGAVVDFMVMRVGAIHTGIFNLADVAIMLGVAWLLVTVHLVKAF